MFINLYKSYSIRAALELALLALFIYFNKLSSILVILFLEVAVINSLVY